MVRFTHSFFLNETATFELKVSVFGLILPFSPIGSRKSSVFGWILAISPIESRKLSVFGWILLTRFVERNCDIWIESQCVWVVPDWKSEIISVWVDFADFPDWESYPCLGGFCRFPQLKVRNHPCLGGFCRFPWFSVWMDFADFWNPQCLVELVDFIPGNYNEKRHGDKLHWYWSGAVLRSLVLVIWLSKTLVARKSALEFALYITVVAEPLEVVQSHQARL